MTEPSPVEAIFFAALEKGSPEERAAYLDAACEGDVELRRRVERLLAMHPKAGDFLEPPARSAGEPTAAYIPPEQVGKTIAGRFKLLEQIGEGGMGAVWVADQLEPVRRRVALKVIKPGMDSRSVLARFEAERQALALMDHPNIAKVHDAGLTDDGRPFFVMELVKGTPITTFCDARKLTARQRLELFVPVCQAVQHAHQKGIIHRDLKPGNVLVALHDERPVPKVIDFGVAKAVGQRLTDKTIYTAFGTLVGTPAYMAPEQAMFNALDVDTRADVYALGVLLYELLAGSPPFELERLRKAALDEVLRVVRDEEPPRPSARLSTSEARATIAAVRQTDPEHLAELMRGELDWIVMKALEKDRARRYETANAFAADVQRYLTGEPVQAVPPSAAYRFRKFLRRNKGPVFAAGVLFLALVIGVIGASIGLVSADAGRRAAERTAASLQVDVDLAEVRYDSEVGLLRLAHTLETLPATEKELREFVTAAVLATGQTYAPLLPPISHDGHDVSHHELSPDARTLLTLGADHTARLWDTQTARLVAVLRRGEERVRFCALTQDGRTAVTDSEDGVLRFWDLPGGAFRAATPPRSDPFSQSRLQHAKRYHRNPIRVAPGRVLTYGNVMDNAYNYVDFRGPVELWDAATGRRIARLDRPGMSISDFEFNADGRWVTTVENKSTVVVFSAEDGQEIGQLIHSDLGPQETICDVVSPNGRTIVTANLREGFAGTRLSIWEGGTWRRLPTRLPQFQTDEFRVLEVGDDQIAIWGDHQWLVCRPGATEPVSFISTTWGDRLDVRGHLLHDGEGILHDLRTGRRLLPPAARRYRPDLARFAPRGRFIGNIEWDNVSVIDTLTDKRIATDGYSDHDWSWGQWERRSLAHLSGTGLCGVVNSGHARWWVLVLPSPVPVIPPDLLELWTQIIVRGELGPGGEFVKWDEPIWERKRQELAAQSAPTTEFPFPGHVARDGLYYLRCDFDEAKIHHNTDPTKLARELLRRAEAIGDHAEAVRWRTELDEFAK